MRNFMYTNSIGGWLSSKDVTFNHPRQNYFFTFDKTNNPSKNIHKIFFFVHNNIPSKHSKTKFRCLIENIIFVS